MKSNRESNYRYSCFWIDFCGDGVFRKPRIKGKDKRWLRKKSQRKVRQEDFMLQEYEAPKGE